LSSSTPWIEHSPFAQDRICIVWWSAVIPHRLFPTHGRYRPRRPCLHPAQKIITIRIQTAITSSRYPTVLVVVRTRYSSSVHVLQDLFGLLLCALRDVLTAVYMHVNGDANETTAMDAQTLRPLMTLPTFLPLSPRACCWGNSPWSSISSSTCSECSSTSSGVPWPSVT
jgi:hypothetical protein